MIDQVIIARRSASLRENLIKIRNADRCLDVNLGIRIASTQHTVLTCSSENHFENKLFTYVGIRKDCRTISEVQCGWL